jgi:chemotaxis response regulator CheB
MAEGSLGRAPQNRDIIVIGGSAGALGAIQRILYDLPSDLPAAIFVVIHLGASSHLAEVLSHNTSLPVIAGESGMLIEQGRIYVAVPGLHLMVHDNHLLLRRGPRENLSRPAIDPLFRFVACSFGGRTIGVLLSGALNDGTAGLQAIKQCGGLAVIQDPRDAAYSEMPLSAQRHIDVDYVRPSAELGPLLVRLTQDPPDPRPRSRTRCGWKPRLRHRSWQVWTSTSSWARFRASPAPNATVRFGRSGAMGRCAIVAMSAMPSPRKRCSPSRRSRPRRCFGD